jgi:hypothetical protein
MLRFWFYEGLVSSFCTLFEWGFHAILWPNECKIRLLKMNRYSIVFPLHAWLTRLCSAYRYKAAYNRPRRILLPTVAFFREMVRKTTLLCCCWLVWDDVRYQLVETRWFIGVRHSCRLIVLHNDSDSSLSRLSSGLAGSLSYYLHVRTTLRFTWFV